MAASNETPIDRQLSEIFDDAYTCYTSLDECDEPTNSLEVQVINLKMRSLNITSTTFS